MKITPTKIEFTDRKPLIIGQRVNMAAAIGSTATVLGFIFPEAAPAIMAASVPVTYFAQILVVNILGVTTAES